MKEINVKELQLNPMTLISDGWMLITAGNEGNGFNTMTASWGHMGAIWGTNKGLPTATVYIRPSRFTKEFVEREEYFTLSFFGNEYKRQLAYLGTHSGRDEDKVAKVGLEPVFDGNTTYFKEADLVLVCRKIYKAPLVEEGFLDQSLITENYPERDFHTMYIGEIKKVLVKD
ncbi:MAG: flavin reductase [Veillonella sp.]|uniref:flavin reductase family protein n=1 Tax=Veillonella sp. TaxID=1926307 RepID=UPI0025F5877E|nr:flavin reductase [Veillonella sp.]MBS4913420.1 flavin reductase [Veillonella sp.]